MGACCVRENTVCPSSRRRLRLIVQECFVDIFLFSKAKSQRRKRTRSFKSDPLASCENLLADPIVRTVDSSEVCK